MRKSVGEKYQTVGLCGSFRKHLDVVSSAHRQFTDSGFEVLAPTVMGEVSNPDDDFVLFESDDSDDPLELEGRYQELLLESDAVYVCNPEGYIGGSVMMELGRLAGRAEVYFMEIPQEPVVREMAKDSVVSAEDFIKYMKLHNEVFWWRDWPDDGKLQQNNFGF